MNISAGKLTRRKIWCLLTSKRVLFPALLGGVLCVVAPGLTSTSGLVGLASFAVAVIAATKSWLTGDKLTERAFHDLQKKARVEHTRYLRELRRGLRGDRDPRTGNLFKKLQRIYDRLLATESWKQNGQTDEIFAEVRDRANQLYESCLRLLERSLAIWRVSRDVATESARRNLSQSREQLIAEVQESVGHLELTLDHMQTAQLKDETGLREDAIRLRTELDQGLEVARQVETRMRELEIDLGGREGSL